MPKISRAEIDATIDELEAATLATDADRVSAPLERLWSARTQAANALVERLSRGQSQVPGLLMEVLASLGGERGPTLLRKIARSAEAPDIVRFGAHRRAGWAAHGETSRRRKFLQTVRDPEGMLIEAIRESSHGTLAQPMVTQEVVGYVPALSGEQCVALVERAARELGAQALPLLQPLAHLDDPATQRLVVAELARLGEPASVGPLDRLARTTTDEELRDAARPAAASCAAPGGGTGTDLNPPLQRAYLSAFDAAGGRMILLVRELAPETFMLLDFLHVDTWGLKDVIGATPVPAASIDGMVADVEAQSGGPVQVHPAAARGALAQAIDDSAANHFSIPMLFEVWEPFVHDRWPAPANEPVVRPELDDRLYARRADLVRRGSDLFGSPYFADWALDRDTTLFGLLLSPVAPGTTSSSDAYAAMAESALTPEVRQRWRTRLRRQAWLADEAGETGTRDLALAVSAALQHAAPRELGKQIFWQVMMKRGLTSLSIPFLADL